MKIHIVANKNWEAEPLLNAFLTRKLYANVGLPDFLQWPLKSYKQPQQTCRAIFSIPLHTVKISCIQDFILDPSKEKSSQYKFETAIPALLKGDDSDFIICFGTAGYPEKIDINASVMMGSKIFIHSDKDAPSISNLNLSQEDSILEQSDSRYDTIFNLLMPEKFGMTVSGLLHKAPNNPSLHPVIAAKNSNVAVSIINITNYDNYFWADGEGVASVNKLFPHLRPASVETTHGLIAVHAQMRQLPVIWVSAITDREGLFDFEVDPKQNYLCAYNAGIALAKTMDILPQM
jgi:hypothetical protein